MPPPLPQARRARASNPVYQTGTVLDPLPPGADEMVELAAVQGGVPRGLINTVSELIEREPDGAITVLRSWLAEGPTT